MKRMNSVHKDKVVITPSVIFCHMIRFRCMSVFEAHHMFSGLTPLQVVTL